MEDKQENKGKIEDILRELGRKIDVLIEEGKDAKDEIRDEVEKKIQELKSKKDELEQEWDEYKQNEKWKEAKSHFMKALHELKAAVESVFSKK